jgi:uracil-DNA glycosylase
VSILPPIPAGWKRLLKQETSSSGYRALEAFLEREAAGGRMILPPRQDIFRSLRMTPYEAVRVLLLGQDPYHTPGMAHGLCFSVRPHVRSLPPSLKNIYRELRDDLGCRIPNNGCLEPWARQGVLMLNTVLTVRAHMPNSHRGCGWEAVTDRIIELVDAKSSRVVFVLWGGEAKKKRRLVTKAQHVVITCAHPSPLSARKFLGCRCFSHINRALAETALAPIDWQIPDV